MEREPDMNNKMTLDFKEIKKDDILTAGGKGANLGEMTAAGIDADTVIPTRSPKYALAPPKITANKIPKITDVTVSSGKMRSAGIYGLNSCS